MAISRPDKQKGELRQALKTLRLAIAGVALASCAMNLLMLTGPIFMLQVYDRVIPSQSGATLIGLSIMALAMYAFQGVMDMIRGRLLLRIGRAFENRLGSRIFDLLSRAATKREGLQSVRDLDAVRAFLSGNGLAAFFDLPWMPVYVAICFSFHLAMGIAVLGGAVVLSALTFLGDVLTRHKTAQLVELSAARNELTEAVARNAVLIGALGMRRHVGEIWRQKTSAYLDGQQRMSDIGAGLGSISRVFRTILQSGVLALGAWLVINGEATEGVMIAATILTIRSLSPVEQAIANWKGFVSARQAWTRLEESFGKYPATALRTEIPAPRRELSVSNVTLAVPGGTNAIVADVSFKLAAGNALGIVGPSGSGKSSLAKALVGAWQPVRGVVRLDGATLDQWHPDILGSHLGYLPQDVELFAGSVTENIARFQSEATPQRLLEAAMAADVHDLVLRLPDGYDTQVGDGGVLLSGGQRQRIGLARAVYGNPFLVVLDEPNASLDAQGEQALARAILAIRKRGGIAIVIAHRPNALVAVDYLMVLNEGRMTHYGRRDDVLAQLGAAPFRRQEEAAPADKPEQPSRKRAPRRRTKDAAVT